MIPRALTGTALLNPFFFCLFYAPLCPSCCVTGTYSHGLQQIRELLQDESQITAHFPLREFGLIPHNPLRLLRGLETPITTKDEQRAEENARLTPCVAQLAACSYSVGWYLLLAGTLQFMNLRGGVRAGGDDRGLSTSKESESESLSWSIITLMKVWKACVWMCV